MTERQQYQITLYFSDLDENMNTHHQAHMDFPNVYADNLAHANLLAQRLEKRLGADDFQVLPQADQIDPRDAEIQQLKARISDDSWITNPDRQGGGGWTADELDPNRGWK